MAGYSGSADIETAPDQLGFGAMCPDRSHPPVAVVHREPARKETAAGRDVGSSDFRNWRISE
jgi:hypothetical protein